MQNRCKMPYPTKPQDYGDEPPMFVTSTCYALITCPMSPCLSSLSLLRRRVLVGVCCTEASTSSKSIPRAANGTAQLLRPRCSGAPPSYGSNAPPPSSEHCCSAPEQCSTNEKALLLKDSLLRHPSNSNAPGLGVFGSCNFFPSALDPEIWAPCVPSDARQTAEVSGSNTLGKKLHEPKTPDPGALLGGRSSESLSSSAF